MEPILSSNPHPQETRLAQADTQSLDSEIRLTALSILVNKIERQEDKDLMLLNLCNGLNQEKRNAFLNLSIPGNFLTRSSKNKNTLILELLLNSLSIEKIRIIVTQENNNFYFKIQDIREKINKKKYVKVKNLLKDIGKNRNLTLTALHINQNNLYTLIDQKLFLTPEAKKSLNISMDLSAEESENLLKEGKAGNFLTTPSAKDNPTLTLKVVGDNGRILSSTIKFKSIMSKTYLVEIFDNGYRPELFFYPKTTSLIDQKFAKDMIQSAQEYYKLSLKAPMTPLNLKKA